MLQTNWIIALSRRALSPTLNFNLCLLTREGFWQGAVSSGVFLVTGVGIEVSQSFACEPPRDHCIDGWTTDQTVEMQWKLSS